MIRQRQLLRAIVLTALATAGCGGAASSGGAPAAVASASAKPATSVVASAAAKPSAAASAAASAAVPASGSPGLVTLKVGTQHVATDGPMYIAQEKGWFKDRGLNVQFTDVNGEEAISAVATGQLDISVGAIYSGLFNAIGRGLDVRLVATKGSITEQPQAKPSSGLVIRKALFDGGTIKDYGDLKGKKIAVASRGATQEESLDNAMHKAGMSIDDVDVKTMPFPDTLPALANGSIDGAMELQPWITQGTASGILTFWKDTADMTPGLQTNALTFGPSITKANQDAGRKFMVAYTQGIRFYNDATGPKQTNWNEFVDIMAKNTSLKDRSLYDKVGWTYFNGDCSLNIASVGQNQDWYAAHGYVKQKVDVNTAVDDSYCQAAVKQLGPYKP
ncbi:MAG TPA: ABC transporter substrate-binding protein [Chloroflexota bacterium]|nr:ABC transporter substrate-binding protein [Chloroflexota bacterium]